MSKAQNRFADNEAVAVVQSNEYLNQPELDLGFVDPGESSFTIFDENVVDSSLMTCKALRLIKIRLISSFHWLL